MSHAYLSLEGLWQNTWKRGKLYFLFCLYPVLWKWKYFFHVIFYICFCFLLFFFLGGGFCFSYNHEKWLIRHLWQNPYTIPLIEGWFSIISFEFAFRLKYDLKLNFIWVYVSINEHVVMCKCLCVNVCV